MKKKKMFHIFDCMVILIVSAFVLLDTFVFTRTYAVADSHESSSETEIQQTAGTNMLGLEKKSTDPEVTASSYSDENIQIEIKEYEYEDSTIYVADVQISDLSYLYSVFANDVYGKNVTAETSEMAASSNAILAINGDYYGARNRGYVIRNGTLYRETSNNAEVLAIMNDGSFEVVSDSTVSAARLLEAGAVQVYSFGPGLIENGEIAVDENDEVGKAKASNPRTAICEIEPLHYLFVVSDGRTDESEGLSLYELAEFLQTLGVRTAYNLDGGGSSTMVFMNEVVNNPTTSGRKISERSVSDAVCIGY